MASYFNKNRFSNNRSSDNRTSNNRTSGNRYNNTRRNTNNLFIQTNENENVQKTYSIKDDFPSLGGIQNTNKDLSSNNPTNKWANLVKNIDNNVIFNIKNIDMSNYVKQDKIRKNTEKNTLNKMKNNYDSIDDDDNMNNYLTFSDNESFYSDECQYYSDCETE
jgi:hypothetical protein